MRIKLFPKSLYLTKVIKNRFRPLLEIINLRTNISNTDTINFRELFLKDLPYINGFFQKHNCFTNWRRNKIEKLRMKHYIFPCTFIQIKKIQNKNGTINENERVLETKSSLRLSWPRKIIGTVQLRFNYNEDGTFAWMDIIYIINIWRSNCNEIHSRRHDECNENVAKCTRIKI